MKLVGSREEAVEKEDEGRGSARPLPLPRGEEVIGRSVKDGSALLQQEDLVRAVAGGET